MLKKYSWQFVFLQLILMAGFIFLQDKNEFTKVWCTNGFFLILVLDYMFFLICFIRYYQKKENLSINGWCLIAVAALTGMFLIFFLGMEETIKQYDATVYWMKSINVSDSLYTNMLDGLRDIRQTLSAEYGNLPVLLFAPFIHYFGKNNIAFCSFTYIVYGIPAISLIILYMIRVIKKCGLENKCEDILVYMSFLCPAMLYPILSGYVDVVGIVWMGILLNISLNWDYSRFTVKRDIELAFVSIVLLFSRRWYAFYIVGFYFSFAIEEAVVQITEKKKSLQRMKYLMMNLLFIAGLACFFIFIFNKAVFQVFLGGDYAEAYAAYKRRSTYMDFIEGFKNLGGIFFVFAVLGVLRLCMQKKLLKYVVKVMIPSAVACILFGTIQSMGAHHMYLLIPHLVILEGIGISTLFGYVKNKKLIYALLTIIFVMNVFLSFSPILTSINTNLMSNIRKYPNKMQNAAVIKEASHYLSKLDGNVYVCGEGNDVSSELFNRCLLPDIETALPNMIPSSIVDMRDGFPSQAFLADYVVIRNPYETGFTDRQQVTLQIWNMLLHSELGKKYYVLDKRYALVQNHAYIEIYKKKCHLHPELIEFVSSQIAEYYNFEKEKEIAYTPNWFNSLANYTGQLNISYYPWDQSVEISGKKDSMDAVFEVDEKFNKMFFSLGNIGDENLLSVYGDENLIWKEKLSWDNNKFEIDISNLNTVRLSVTGGKEFSYHIFNQSIE